VAVADAPAAAAEAAEITYGRLRVTTASLVVLVIFYIFFYFFIVSDE